MRRVFIIRKDLKLPAGKLAAMVAHCAEGYWLTLLRNGFDGTSRVEPDTLDPTEYHFSVYLPANEVDDYIKGLFTKTICEARNLNQLMKAETIAKELGLKEGEDYGFIDDSCKTVLTPEFTDEDGIGRCRVGVWFKPLDDDVAHQISKKFPLYRD